jgi:hypothetical protein
VAINAAAIALGFGVLTGLAKNDEIRRHMRGL